MTDSTPAGWYPEPDSSRERWWDGRAWTDQTQDRAPSPAPATARTARPIWPWILGGSAVVVVAIAVVTVLILTSVLGSLVRSSTKDDGASRKSSASSAAPGGATGDGIVLGSGGDDAVRVVTYIDYFCPFCGQFEATNARQLSDWVESGDVVLEVHPIAILDRSSLGTKYSTRAANAAACVADSAPDRFASFNALLFENQPEENTEGLSDADLIGLVDEAEALEGTGVADCIDTGRFIDWVTDATARALKGPLPNSDVDTLSGTPTVIVDGVQYLGGLDDPEEFADFVLRGES
ncbi:thioredoxin domain-containing protein [Agreia sp.]|uniref:thioredoxin domain-containing protein n=1 Tax=Agreia sp. TaxID=1872416 RepID=UPI0035BC011A